MKKFLIVAVLSICVLIGLWFFLSCTAGAPMVVHQDAMPSCGCKGWNLVLKDHWAEDGDRLFLCIGIPE